VAHATRLANIDELAASFAEIERGRAATSVFEEMTRILSEQGVDEAIAYVGSQRNAILQTVCARVAAARECNRADLQPLLRAAALHENKGQATHARAFYADILSAEPDWPDALHGYIYFLANQGDHASVRTTQEDARRDYDEARRLALHLTVLGGWAAERKHCRRLRFQGSLTPYRHRENRSCAILRGHFSDTHF